MAGGSLRISEGLEKFLKEEARNVATDFEKIAYDCRGNTSGKKHIVIYKGDGNLRDYFISLIKNNLRSETYVSSFNEDVNNELKDIFYYDFSGIINKFNNRSPQSS